MSEVEKPEVCTKCPRYDECEGSNQEDCERRGRLLLTPKEKLQAFADYPCLDPSFEDDYRSEVETLLEAQIDKVLKAGYRPLPEGDDEGLVNLGEAAGDLFFPKYLGLRADELEVIMRWAADFGNRARKAQKALTESKYEPVQLEVLGELKKKYLRAVWKSIKKGAGDCSIPQDYLVFMIPSDEWQILEATNKANEDKLGQLYRRKDEQNQILQ